MASVERIPRLTILLGVLLSAPVSSQVWPLDLRQAASRNGKDLAPTFEGQQVSVIGQISTKPIPAGSSYFLPIQDAGSYGLIIDGPLWQFASLNPGDWIEVTGTIGQRSGLPVLKPQAIQKTRSSAPPVPLTISAKTLNSNRYLGVLVSFDGYLSRISGGPAGDLLEFYDGTGPAQVLLPLGKTSFRPGQHLNVIGIASQEQPVAPYDRGFLILAPDVSALTLINRTWTVPSWVLLWALAFASSLLLVWWISERRMAAQRRTMRILNQLSEDVIVATTPAEILVKLNTILPKIADGIQPSLYVWEKTARHLALVSSDPTLAVFIRPSDQLQGLPAAVASCFRNATLLIVPDTRRSPFVNPKDQSAMPRSMMLVPMFSQSDLLGVIAFHYFQSSHNFTLDEQAAMQHLANQAGAALNLQAQKSVRERHFRSEKLVAAGQLISSIAGELRAPLNSILDLTTSLKTRRAHSYDPEIDLIEADSLRASEIVTRLLAFGKTDLAEPRPLDLHSLLARLLRLRTHERKLRGIEIHAHFLGQKIMLLGSQGQLEQVFLTLLVHAEQAAAQARDIAMSISTTLMARRALIEIGYHTELTASRKPNPFDGGDVEGSSVGLSLCRGIVQSHGGDIRFVRVSATQSRFEVELPTLDAPSQMLTAGAPADASNKRQLTALLVEPDLKSQKHVTKLLSARGDRVVPVVSAEEAADLAHRVRFDVVFCSVRLPGLGWAKLFERVRGYASSFVLLAQAPDPDVSKAFHPGEGYVLLKPVEEAQLNALCDVLALKAAETTA